jgi:hypothetical protein
MLQTIYAQSIINNNTDVMHGFYSFDIKYDALHKDLKHLQSHSTRKRLLTYHKMYSSCKIFSK